MDQNICVCVSALVMLKVGCHPESIWARDWCSVHRMGSQVRSGLTANVMLARIEAKNSLLQLSSDRFVTQELLSPFRKLLDEHGSDGETATWVGGQELVERNGATCSHPS